MWAVPETERRNCSRSLLAKQSKAKQSKAVCAHRTRKDATEGLTTQISSAASSCGVRAVSSETLVAAQLLFSAGEGISASLLHRFSLIVGPWWTRYVI
eukprot:SAG31_NODE_3733_length_3940_cov_2.160115_5_plen_98_part_00